MPGLGHKSYIQIGPKETSYGDYLAPTRKLEIINWNIAPVIGSMMDASLSGNPSRRAIYQGGLLYRGNFSVRLNYEGLEELLRGVFGSYTITAAGDDVQDHTFGEGSTLNSYTFEVALGDVPTGKVFRLLGAKLTGLTIRGSAGSGSDGILTADFSVVAKDYLSNQTPVASTTTTVANCTPSSYTLTRAAGSFTTDGIVAGMAITHPDVPAGTVVVGTPATTTLKMSQAATGSTQASASFKTMQAPAIWPVLYTHAVTINDGTSDTAANVRVRSFEVTLEQPHSEDRFYLGSVNIDEPLRQDFLVARFKFTQEFTTKTQHDAARAFTVGAPTLLFRNTAENFGNNKYREFLLQANKANLVEFSSPIEGYGVMISTATWEAYYDATLGSALVARVRNKLTAIS